MTITAVNAGPTVWVKIAEVHEDRGEWIDAASAWNTAAHLTMPWNPHLARRYENRGHECLDRALA